MTWSDVTRPPRPKVVRQFGLVCLLVFGSLGLFQVLARSRLAVGGALITLALVCGLLGWIAPALLRWVYTGAMLLAFPIGFAVSQVMLAILFFMVFVPLGAGLRLRGWDALQRRPKPRAHPSGYWEPKTRPADPARYLRQY